jgi:hypothetical protein
MAAQTPREYSPKTLLRLFAQKIRGQQQIHKHLKNLPEHVNHRHPTQMRENE